MNAKYDLVVDFARPTKSNTIIVSEGDVDSRICHFTLLVNKSAMSMLDVTSATVRGVKEDGSVVFGDAVIVTDDDGNKLNEVEYTIPAAITDEAGNVTMTITLMDALNHQITSFEFYIKVRNALYNEDDYVSESDLSGFRDLLNRCLVAVQKMEAMTENTALPCPYSFTFDLEGVRYEYSGAEAISVELKDMAYISGAYDPETSIDETAAAAAAASATAAAASEYNAALSESAAGGYESATKGYRDDALGYKNTAQNAAGTAQGYLTLIQQVFDSANLPTTAGEYHLKVTIVDDNPVYSWVSA
jgi:hypothetical protein